MRSIQNILIVFTIPILIAGGWGMYVLVEGFICSAKVYNSELLPFKYIFISIFIIFLPLAFFSAREFYLFPDSAGFRLIESCGIRLE